jgi:hypothetical protein
VAAVFQNFKLDPYDQPAASRSKLTDLSGVFRGRELTRKNRRIASSLPPIDNLLGGGIVRGRISEFFGATGSGKTSLAMRFAAQVTRNEAAAWIESGDYLDPASMLAAGIEPSRMLWVSCRAANLSHRSNEVREADDCAGLDFAAARNRGWRRHTPIASLKAAEWILTAGGFGLLVLDFAATIQFLPQSVALRLARAAERSGTAVIVLGEHPMCGTFATLSLALKRRQACFNRTRPASPATFDGQLIEAQVVRNKLGGACRSTVWTAATDPSSFPSISNNHDQAQLRINARRKLA